MFVPVAGRITKNGSRRLIVAQMGIYRYNAQRTHARVNDNKQE